MTSSRGLNSMNQKRYWGKKLRKAIFVCAEAQITKCALSLSPLASSQEDWSPPILLPPFLPTKNHGVSLLEGSSVLPEMKGSRHRGTERWREASVTEGPQKRGQPWPVFSPVPLFHPAADSELGTGGSEREGSGL